LLNSRTQKGRSEPRRTKSEVVQVFGLNGKGRPFHQSASTIDVSYRGARLRGLSCWDQPGEIIGIRFGSEKARFQVVWIGKANTAHEAQIGLCCLEPGRNIWDQHLAEAAQNQAGSLHLGPATPIIFRQESPNGTNTLGNRRSSARYRASGRAQVREIGGTAWRWAMLCDMSTGGCYLEMPAPFPAGKQLEINLTVGGIQFHVRADVTGCHPYVGMALQFKPLTPLNQERLRKVMQLLAQTQVPV
jgi:PilZ domain